MHTLVLWYYSCYYSRVVCILYAYAYSMHTLVVHTTRVALE